MILQNYYAAVTSVSKSRGIATKIKGIVHLQMLRALVLESMLSGATARITRDVLTS